MKKIYTAPICDIKEFAAKDIITTSSITTNTTQTGFIKFKKSQLEKDF